MSANTDADADGDAEADVEVREEMWYCPECNTWCGYELDACVSGGHPKPAHPVYHDEPDDAREYVRQATGNGYGARLIRVARRVRQRKGLVPGSAGRGGER